MLLGWLKTKRKLCYSLVMFTSFAMPAQTADDDELPDMALLEYLAELVEVDGELVGPLDMAEVDEQAIDTKATDKDEQTAKPKDQSTDSPQEDKHD